MWFQIYHLESRWRNSHVLVYHGPHPKPRFGSCAPLLSLRCEICKAMIERGALVDSMTPDHIISMKNVKKTHCSITTKNDLVYNDDNSNSNNNNNNNNNNNQVTTNNQCKTINDKQPTIDNTQLQSCCIGACSCGWVEEPPGFTLWRIQHMGISTCCKTGRVPKFLEILVGGFNTSEKY